MIRTKKCVRKLLAVWVGSLIALVVATRLPNLALFMTFLGALASMPILTEMMTVRKEPSYFELLSYGFLSVLSIGALFVATQYGIYQTASPQKTIISLPNGEVVQIAYYPSNVTNVTNLSRVALLCLANGFNKLPHSIKYFAVYKLFMDSDGSIKTAKLVECGKLPDIKTKLQLLSGQGIVLIVSASIIVLVFIELLDRTLSGYCW